VLCSPWPCQTRISAKAGQRPSPDMAIFVLDLKAMDTSTQINKGSSPIPLLTVEDVRRRLGVSPGWVHDHANGRCRPVLPSLRLGGCRSFDAAALDRFIEECHRIDHVA